MTQPPHVLLAPKAALVAVQALLLSGRLRQQVALPPRPLRVGGEGDGGTVRRGDALEGLGRYSVMSRVSWR